MKTSLCALAFLTCFTTSAQAEGLFRQQLDNTLNNVQTFLGDDSIDHEVRRLTDAIALLDTEQKRLLAVLEGKRQNRQDLALALQNLGVASPPPVLDLPVLVPDPESGLNKTCLMSVNAVPIACW